MKSIEFQNWVTSRTFCVLFCVNFILLMFSICVLCKISLRISKSISRSLFFLFKFLRSEKDKIVILINRTLLFSHRREKISNTKRININSLAAFYAEISYTSWHKTSINIHCNFIFDGGIFGVLVRQLSSMASYFCH